MTTASTVTIALSRTPALADIPGLNDEVVNALNALYPERCPDPNDLERHIWMYAGARELVRKLVLIRERQRKESLQNFDQQ